MTTLYSVYLFIIMVLYVEFRLLGCSVYNDVIYLFTVILHNVGKGHALSDMSLSHNAAIDYYRVLFIVIDSYVKWTMEDHGLETHDIMVFVGLLLMEFVFKNNLAEAVL